MAHARYESLARFAINQSKRKKAQREKKESERSCLYSFFCFCLPKTPKPKENMREKYRPELQKLWQEQYKQNLTERAQAERNGQRPPVPFKGVSAKR